MILSMQMESLRYTHFPTWEYVAGFVIVALICVGGLLLAKYAR